jgi:hypothetical protein
MDNVQDMISKGRQCVLRGAEHPLFGKRPPCIRVGSKHGMAILDEARVGQYKAWRAAGVRRQDAAAKLGVSPQVCYAIDRGITWKHVEAALDSADV